MSKEYEQKSPKMTPAPPHPRNMSKTEFQFPPKEIVSTTNLITIYTWANNHIFTCIHGGGVMKPFDIFINNRHKNVYRVFRLFCWTCLMCRINKYCLSVLCCMMTTMPTIFLVFIVRWLEFCILIQWMNCSHVSGISHSDWLSGLLQKGKVEGFFHISP